MEARIGAESRQLYGPGTSEMMIGRGGMEWDLNDWNWDGNLFVATPLKVVQSDCRSKQLFPVNMGLSNGMLSCAGEAELRLSSRGRDELEKRRRVAVMEEDEGGRQAGPLALNLGGMYPVVEVEDFTNGDVNNSKRSKIQAGNVNRGMCQVEECGADLSEAKDYHRRHKVCEMHAKASRAIVGNSVQRFCQQCSRFHLLQEFDEGKRSCRRRLAGHNKRRRKTHPDTIGNEASMSNDQASSYLLISLLRILSNVQSNGNGETKDQDLLCHFLKNLANLAGSFDSRNLSALLQASQEQHKGNSAGPSSDAAQAIISRCITANESHKPLDAQGVPDSNGKLDNATSCPVASSVEIARKVSLVQYHPEAIVQKDKSKTQRPGVNNFDLNDVYQGEPDIVEEPEQVENSKSQGTGSPNYPLWLLQDSHRSSPPQTSGHSNSLSSDSRVSSNGDAQSRTDRIVFKLFGKDPTDFPLELRNQILGWLSSTPSDVESYIRPGCIILTLYLCLADSTWKELSHDLSSSLRKLLNLASSEFWQMGWIYVRMQHQMAFIYNGQLLLGAPLLQSCHSQCRIWNVTPLAASISERITFTVKGYNVITSTMRLLCSFEGKYLVDEATQSLTIDTTAITRSDFPQCLRFSCSVPSTSGRGFIEVEDQGLSSAFFPFIVAEKEICTEICTLESTIDLSRSTSKLEEESAAMKSRARALHFVHEMGWLLRRLRLESRDSHSERFRLVRLKWLLEFAIERDWCAVLKKLLDALVGGFVDTAGCPVESALSEVGLLHLAVQKNSKSMVELLLRYKFDKSLGSGQPNIGILSSGFLFSPDMVSAYGITPLHIAASRGDSLGVLDALTNDARQVGITTWKSARDASGFTPEDYARSRGFNSYLQLIEKKISERSNAGHVVLDVSTGNPASSRIVPEETKIESTGKQTGFEIDKMALRSAAHPSHCKVCSQQELAFINKKTRSSLLYRPAMLAMVGIATVCVCVGLLLKGPPEVLYVYPPFRWELLDYGPM